MSILFEVKSLHVCFISFSCSSGLTVTTSTSYPPPFFFFYPGNSSLSVDCRGSVVVLFPIVLLTPAIDILYVAAKESEAIAESLLSTFDLLNRSFVRSSTVGKPFSSTSGWGRGVYTSKK